MQASEIQLRSVPRHLAIIMDGNNRWARREGYPGVAGHRAGAEVVREIVSACEARGIRYLTLFAFSSENWGRPRAEVRALLALLSRYLRNEVTKLKSDGVRLRVIGRRDRFSPHLQRLIASAEKATEAEERRTQLWHHVREFMEAHEFMVWPVNPVPPFPSEQETLMEVGGVKMATYVDWGALRHVISVVGLPSISVPVGFTRDGLPIGLQITGRHNQDFALLQLAAAFERETQYWRQRPSFEI